MSTDTIEFKIEEAPAIDLEDSPNDSPTSEAPWGYKKDGTPKQRPGRRPSGNTASSVPGAPRPIRRAAAKKGQPDYRPGMMGIAQMIAAPLVMIGAQRKSEALQADGLTVITHSPPVVEAINDLAHDDPRVAAILDKVMAVGPYGALVGAVIPMVTQLLRNHAFGPKEVLESMGAKAPEKLISEAMAA